jgi:uncharacterized membrane protein YfcA
LPFLVGLGLSPFDAVGTNMIGALGFVIGSAFSRSARGTVRRDHLKQLILIVVAASFIGPLISVHLAQSTVKLTSGLLIIFTALISLLTWKMASHSREVSAFHRYGGYSLYFISSVFLAGFGAGVGLLSNYILIGLVGMSAIETISTRRIAGLIGVPIQLSIFAFHGHTNLKFGIPLFIGFWVGGWLGLNFAVNKGNEFVKKAMAVAAIILVLTLFI